MEHVNTPALKGDSTPLAGDSTELWRIREYLKVCKIGARDHVIAAKDVHWLGPAAVVREIPEVRVVGGKN